MRFIDSEALYNMPGWLMLLAVTISTTSEVGSIARLAVCAGPMVLLLHMGVITHEQYMLLGEVIWNAHW